MGDQGDTGAVTLIDIAIKIAVLQNTVVDHEKRLDKLEGLLGWILGTALVSAVGAAGSLLMLVLTHGKG